MSAVGENIAQLVAFGPLERIGDIHVKGESADAVDLARSLEIGRNGRDIHDDEVEPAARETSERLRLTAAFVFDRYGRVRQRLPQRELPHRNVAVSGRVGDAQLGRRDGGGGQNDGQNRHQFHLPEPPKCFFTTS